MFHHTQHSTAHTGQHTHATRKLTNHRHAINARSGFNQSKVDFCMHRLAFVAHPISTKRNQTRRGGTDQVTQTDVLLTPFPSEKVARSNDFSQIHPFNHALYTHKIMCPKLPATRRLLYSVLFYNMTALECTLRYLPICGYNCFVGKVLIIIADRLIVHHRCYYRFLSP